MSLHASSDLELGLERHPKKKQIPVKYPHIPKKPIVTNFEIRTIKTFKGRSLRRGLSIFLTHKQFFAISELQLSSTFIF
jgi:hypothetical protein